MGAEAGEEAGDDAGGDEDRQVEDDGPVPTTKAATAIWPSCADGAEDADDPELALGDELVHNAHDDIAQKAACQGKSH